MFSGRIANLMSAQPGSPEGDELDILATLVDAYEQDHFPIEAADPIEYFRYHLRLWWAELRRPPTT